MNKIVKGKIVSIDATLEKGSDDDKGKDYINYHLTLDNGNKYKMNCSIENQKIGDDIRILVFGDEATYGNYGNVILNEKVAAKMLKESRSIKIFYYTSFLFIGLFSLLLIKEISIKNIEIMPALSLFSIIAYAFYKIYDIPRNNNFSEEDKKLFKKYKNRNTENSDINLNKIKEEVNI